MKITRRVLCLSAGSLLLTGAMATSLHQCFEYRVRRVLVKLDVDLRP